jgi:uncharacterized repeat protein (TIGR03803 family)
MTSKVQHESYRSSISGIRLRAATAALALGTVHLLATTSATSQEQEPQEAPTYTLLHTFTGEPDGSQPFNGLILDKAGNLYGTTTDGGTGTCNFGAAGCGVVFKVDTTGKEAVLYAFTGGTDGANPFLAGLVRDRAGNLYGTTYDGGDLSGCGGSGCGVVFKLGPTGKESVLYSFTGGADGGSPTGNLVRDSAGNLFGTTDYGGDLSGCNGSGCGVVFKLDPTGKETILYAFTGGTDGSNPLFEGGSLIRDAAGNLYATTYSGGDLSGCGGSGCGVVFELDATGKETVLYSFTGGTDGGNPGGGLVGDSVGNLYGTTQNYGSSGCGVVFKVQRATHKETLLHSFTCTDGNVPSGLIRDPAGNLYGTTEAGGANGAGNVFKLDTTGTLTALHSFTFGCTDGCVPFAGVIRDKEGNLYGTAQGGASNDGVVFKLAP